MVHKEALRQKSLPMKLSVVEPSLKQIFSLSLTEYELNSLSDILLFIIHRQISLIIYPDYFNGSQGGTEAKKSTNEVVCS